MGAMPPRPSVKAILICDQIIHEFGTNKKSLIGIFQDIHLAQFPFRFPRTDVSTSVRASWRELPSKRAQFGSR